jgi:hypothetical protein
MEVPMNPEMEPTPISAVRADLASFDHAYAVALRLRGATGRHQFVVRTGNPIQPFRTANRPPGAGEHLLALIV